MFTFMFGVLNLFSWSLYSYPKLLVLNLFNGVFICKWELEFFHQLVHSTDGVYSLGCARQQPGASSRLLTALGWQRPKHLEKISLLSSETSREIDRKWGRLYSDQHQHGMFKMPLSSKCSSCPVSLQIFLCIWCSVLVFICRVTMSRSK